MLLKEHQQIHKHPELLCNYANKIQELLQKLYKCQYLSIMFAKILIGIKILEKQKTRKNRQIFDKWNMCNNTIKITLNCITTRKATKGINIIIDAVDGQGLANNYDTEIQGKTNFRSTFVMLK